MNEFKELTPELSVAAQLGAADLEAAARAGFRTIINNRPDREDGGQPDNEALAARARELGLEWHHLPVTPGALTDVDIARFGQLLSQAPKPILAFCRTGTRCTMLWALAAAPQSDLNALAGRAASVGYDLSGIMPRLRDRQREG